MQREMQLKILRNLNGEPKVPLLWNALSIEDPFLVCDANANGKKEIKLSARGRSRPTFFACNNDPLSLVSEQKLVLPLQQLGTLQQLSGLPNPAKAFSSSEHARRGGN